MVFVRRRYYFWLVKAYFRRWKKTILVSAIVGVLLFFLAILSFNYYFLPRLENKVKKIGYAGVYEPQTIPEEIVYDVSYGLTIRDENGEIKPGLAQRWEVKNNGREFTFYLKKGLKLHNGDPINANTLEYNFKDVQKKVLDDYTISYVLKNPYAPFLSTVTKPFIIGNFQGAGRFKLTNADINAGFVRSLNLESVQDEKEKKIIFFYPTQEALKNAFMLGEVNSITHVRDLRVKNTSLDKWKDVEIEKSTNYKTLLTLFYNTSDSALSNKKLRQALDYSIPSVFTDGERAYSPIPPNSIYFSQPPNYGISDPEISKTLLEDLEPQDYANLELTTTEEFEPVARNIIESWKRLGIEPKLKIVTKMPTDFQMFLHPVALPKDPDQYTLWHSQQVNNISRYKNLRIDKLLEDGRSVSDTVERQSIYADFQKYLIDDVPASFIYFPYEYTISRR